MQSNAAARREKTGTSGQSYLQRAWRDTDVGKTNKQKYVTKKTPLQAKESEAWLPVKCLEKSTED